MYSTSNDALTSLSSSDSAGCKDSRSDGLPLKPVTWKDFIPEVIPKGVSAANGLAEGAVKEIKAKCRTLKYATDQMYGVELPPTHPCLPWLVLYSAQLINSFWACR